MSARINIPPRRDDCAIEALGHHPNVIQVLRFAGPQRLAGEGLSIHRIDCRLHIDDLGSAGIYRLHHDDVTMEVFDHDPDRFAAVLAHEAGQPITWTPAGILYVASYCFSVAPIEQLDARSPCGADPWARWLAGEADERPTGGGFLIPGTEVLVRYGLTGDSD